MAEQPRELLLQELLFKMRPFLESVLLENEDDSVGAARKLLAALQFLQRAVDLGMPLAQPSLAELVCVAVAELGTLARLGVAPGDFVKLFYMREWLRRGLAQEEPWAANSETDSSETADSLHPSQPEAESHMELSGVPPKLQVPAPVKGFTEEEARELHLAPHLNESHVVVEGARDAEDVREAPKQQFDQHEHALAEEGTQRLDKHTQKLEAFPLGALPTDHGSDAQQRWAAWQARCCEVVQPVEPNAERPPMPPDRNTLIQDHLEPVPETLGAAGSRRRVRSWSCGEAVEMSSWLALELRLRMTYGPGAQPDLIVLEQKGRRCRRVDEAILQSPPARRLREDGLTDEHLRPEWAHGAKILVKGFTEEEAAELRCAPEIAGLNQNHVVVEGDRAAQEVRQVLREQFRFNERPKMKEVARRRPKDLLDRSSLFRGSSCPSAAV